MKFTTKKTCKSIKYIILSLIYLLKPLANKKILIKKLQYIYYLIFFSGFLDRSKIFDEEKIYCNIE